jgi:hypothetical protein
MRHQNPSVGNLLAFRLKWAQTSDWEAPDMTQMPDSADVEEREERGTETHGQGEQHRYRRRYSIRRHRSVWQRWPALMLLVVSLPAALFLFWLSAYEDGPHGRQEALTVETSPTVVRGAQSGAGVRHGVAALFAPPPAQQQLPDGFGPARSPWPYLVVWLPILLVLEFVRRELFGRGPKHPGEP